MLKFGIKLGLAGGAVYYVADQGVWKSSDEAVVICKKISDNVSPYTQEITKQIPFELPSLPQTNEVSYLAKYYWNKGVKGSCAFLADLPSNVGYYTDQGINYVTESKEFKNLFSSEEPTEKPKEPEKTESKS